MDTVLPLPPPPHLLNHPTHTPLRLGGAGRRRLGTAAAAVVVAVVAAATAVTRAAAYAQRRQRQKQKLVRMNGLKYVMHAVEW